MSTWIGRYWEDWRAWRACRDVSLYVQIPEPEPKLNYYETFLHLSPRKRVALVVIALVGYILAIQGTYSANVFPHIQAAFKGGGINVHELVQSLYLSGVVVMLSLSTLFIWRAPWSGKVGLIIASLLMAYTSANNACLTQEAGRSARFGDAKSRNERIKTLNANIGTINVNWDLAKGQLLTKEPVSADRVAGARSDLEEARKSAHDECHRGLLGNTRGPECKRLEGERDKKSAEVDRLQHDKDLTDRMNRLEKDKGAFEEELRTLGAQNDDDKPKAAGLPAFLARINAIGDKTALALTEDTPSTDALTMEAQAWFFAPAWVALVFYLFSLLVCDKTEAAQRVHETTIQMAANYAEKAVAELQADETPAPKVIRPDVWFKPAWMKDDPEPEPKAEVNHAEVLGIDEPQPAFVEKPETAAEAMAAAFIKADIEKKPRRPRKPKGELQKPHKSTVVQWHRERCFEAEGRVLWSTEARPDYERWCWSHGYEPVSPQTFGRTLRKECGVRADNTNRGGKYYDIGLRPAGLRVVAG
jgi:hypothetical protein